MLEYFMLKENEILYKSEEEMIYIYCIGVVGKKLKGKKTRPWLKELIFT